MTIDTGARRWPISSSSVLSKAGVEDGTSSSAMPSSTMKRAASPSATAAMRPKSAAAAVMLSRSMPGARPPTR